MLKNVTGLDLCKLLTGSHGTLGVITEITLKVLPAPEADRHAGAAGAGCAESGVAALSAALGSPYGVSGAAWLPAEAVARIPELAGVSGSATLIRIEDFAPSVAYRLGRLNEQFAIPGAMVLDDAASRTVWRSGRRCTAAGRGTRGRGLAVSVRPSAGPEFWIPCGRTALRGFLDWGGGLVWLAGRADATTHQAVEAAAMAARRNMDVAAGAGRRCAERFDVIPDEAAPLARITREVKAAMDPAGILNPGRLYAGL